MNRERNSKQLSGDTRLSGYGYTSGHSFCVCYKYYLLMRFVQCQQRLTNDAVRAGIAVKLHFESRQSLRMCYSTRQVYNYTRQVVYAIIMSYACIHSGIIVRSLTHTHTLFDMLCTECVDDSPD